MSKKLANKIAVVTGGSAGIGLGAAKRLAEEGAQVFITGRRQSELDKAAAEIDGNVTAINGDASKLADVDRIMPWLRESRPHRRPVHQCRRLRTRHFGKIAEEHSTRSSTPTSTTCFSPCRRRCRFCPTARRWS